MPPAKKSATRASARGAARSAPMPASTRRQLEQAAKRLERSLEDASQALQALGQNKGHGAHRTYKDLAPTVKALRRDAAKTKRSLLKDLEQLRAAVTPTKAAAPKPRAKQSSGVSKGARTATKKASSATRARRSG